MLFFFVEASHGGVFCTEGPFLARRTIYLEVSVGGPNLHTPVTIAVTAKSPSVPPDQRVWVRKDATALGAAREKPVRFSTGDPPVQRRIAVSQPDRTSPR